MQDKPLDRIERDLLDILCALHADRGPIERNALSVEVRGRGLELARPLGRLKTLGLAEEITQKPSFLRRVFGAQAVTLVQPTAAGLARVAPEPEIPAPEAPEPEIPEPEIPEVDVDAAAPEARVPDEMAPIGAEAPEPSAADLSAPETVVAEPVVAEPVVVEPGSETLVPDAPASETPPSDTVDAPAPQFEAPQPEAPEAEALAPAAPIEDAPVAPDPAVAPRPAPTPAARPAGPRRADLWAFTEELGGVPVDADSVGLDPAVMADLREVLETLGLDLTHAGEGLIADRISRGARPGDALSQLVVFTFAHALQHDAHADETPAATELRGYAIEVMRELEKLRDAGGIDPDLFEADMRCLWAIVDDPVAARETVSALLADPVGGAAPPALLPDFLRPMPEIADLDDDF